MTDHDEVLAANEAFYRAFRDRDIASMEDLWAREQPVACIHPGWRALAGRSVVLESWRALMDNPRSPTIHPKAATVFLQDDSAFVICTEDLGAAELVATNIFVREDDGWRIAHHHAGPGRGLADDDDPDVLH